MLKRSQGQILDSSSELSKYLYRILPRRPACIIVRCGRFVRIFKLNRVGEVFTVTARSIREDDRKRLVAEGYLRR
jgi:hypothetical protein